ncbi:hypothetical protein LINPERPRIM_LOCUS28237 [Linum perenne]
MGSEAAPKSVVVHVTGFKKFQGVVQNPTETIVTRLKDYVEKQGLPAGVTLGSCTVLETAGDGAVSMLYKTLESSTTTATNAEKNEQVVWVCNQFLSLSLCSYRVDSYLILHASSYSASLGSEQWCNEIRYRTTGSKRSHISMPG